ncbi:MAG: hypothetical protein L6R37_006283 [Teloschistes peruensis]|nr:MAG: hypothetical protein L6R37_006283 [Teloschistes peruensis]
MAGLATAKNPEYLEAAAQYPQDVLVGGEALQVSPAFLAPAVISVITRNHRALNTMLRYLEPLIERGNTRTYPESVGEEEPLDVVQCIIDAIRKDDGWDARKVLGEALALWFGSVHQLAMRFVYALYDICEHPECIGPMREEIEQFGDGWVSSLDKLPLLDSFLRESARLNPSDSRVKSDFVNPPSLADALITVNLVFLILMVLVVSARIYTRGVLLRTLGWDDWKLFEVKKILRCLIWAGIAVQVVGYAGLIGERIAEYYICNLDLASHSLCRNSYKFTNIQAVFSVLTDFYVLLLPVKVILGLHMSWRRKLGVMSVFVTGLLVVEINCRIIAGALNVFPAFICKSGLSSLGRSAFSAIRGRLFGRPESSDPERSPPRSTIPAKKARNPRDGRYVELGALPMTTATAWAGGVSDPANDWSLAEKTSRHGILRRDDYEVSHPPSQVACSYQDV